MVLIGWHTEVASRSRSEKESCPAGHDSRRRSPSYSGGQDILAGTGTMSQPWSVKSIGKSAESHGEALLPANRDLVWTVQIP